MNPLFPRTLVIRTLLLAALTLTAAGAAAQTPTFDPPVGYGVPLVPWNPLLPAQGDFNNDGHVDMLVSNGDRVQVLLGTGTGTLGALKSSFFSKHLQGYNIAVGDVDNDGNLDIASGSNMGWGFWYLLVARGNGDGTFRDVVSYNMPCCGGVRTTTFVDLNNDGWLDMVGSEANFNVRVYINQAGTFALNGTATLFQSGINPQDAAVGDFNNDGHADFVLANRDAGGSLQVYLNNGTSTPSPQPLLALAPGEAGRNLAAADLNADGCDDIAHINWAGRAVDVYLSHCTGSFSTLTSYNFDPVGPTAANGYRIADEVVDLDGDGNRDLVVSNSSGRGRKGNAIFVLPGIGDGTFGAASSHPNPVEPPAPACCPWVNENLVFPAWGFAADLNEDGRPDLITAANNDRPIAVLLNSSPVADPDSDGDGVPDDEDAFPSDPTETSDTDDDGVGDNGDAFPNDPRETRDSDGDGVGDNGDAFPNDPRETRDSDGDGVGDNGDAFPNDPTESRDSDGDGVGDNADVFPNDPTETRDSDGDGVGDNGDLYPNDPSAWANLTISGVTTSVPARNGAQAVLSSGEASCTASPRNPNHGQYLSCVGRVLNAMKAQSMITAAEKGYLESIAARSATGKR